MQKMLSEFKRGALQFVSTPFASIRARFEHVNKTEELEPPLIAHSRYSTAGSRPLSLDCIIQY